MKLIAIRRLRYASRAFSAGETFEAKSKRDAQILVYATKRARFAEDEPVPVPAPAPAISRVQLSASGLVPAGDDIDRLRERAERLGIKVDGRWGVGRLAEEIDAVAAR